MLPKACADGKKTSYAGNLTPEAMMMPEPRSSLPLTDYKALRDSLREKRELLPEVALHEALKGYLAQAMPDAERAHAAPSLRERAGH